MKDVLNKLIKLCNKEYALGREIVEMRKEQGRLCEKELVGECFRIKRPSSHLIEGEEYEEYLCFTEVLSNFLFHEEKCSLTAIRVMFSKLDKGQELGPSVDETSSDLSSWLTNIADDKQAEQISYAEFKAAFDRASAYLSEKAQCAKVN